MGVNLIMMLTMVVGLAQAELVPLNLRVERVAREDAPADPLLYQIYADAVIDNDIRRGLHLVVTNHGAVFVDLPMADMKPELPIAKFTIKHDATHVFDVEVFHSSNMTLFARESLSLKVDVKKEIVEIQREWAEMDEKLFAIASVSDDGRLRIEFTLPTVWQDVAEEIDVTDKGKSLLTSKIEQGLISGVLLLEREAGRREWLELVIAVRGSGGMVLGRISLPRISTVLASDEEKWEMCSEKNVVLGMAEGYLPQVLTTFVISQRDSLADNPPCAIFFMSQITSAVGELLRIGGVRVALFRHPPEGSGPPPPQPLDPSEKPLDTRTLRQNLRHVLMSRLLKLLPPSVELVLSSDTRDVFFQCDPFPQIARYVSSRNASLIIPEEMAKLSLGVCPSNGWWIRRGWGQNMLDKLKDKKPVNVGVVFGTVKAMISLADKMAASIESVSTFDQGHLNYLIYNNLLSEHNPLIVPEGEGPIATVGVFRPEEVPVDEELTVVSVSDRKTPMCVVHQATGDVLENAKDKWNAENIWRI